MGAFGFPNLSDLRHYQKRTEFKKIVNADKNPNWQQATLMTGQILRADPERLFRLGFQDWRDYASTTPPGLISALIH